MLVPASKMSDFENDLHVNTKPTYMPQLIAIWQENLAMYICYKDSATWHKN